MNKEWFTAPELAGLPGLPGTSRGINKMGDRGQMERRPRQVGKGWEYSLQSLPQETQAALVLRSPSSAAATGPEPDVDAFTYEPEALWQRWEYTTEKNRTRAQAKCALLIKVEQLVGLGLDRRDAFERVAFETGQSAATMRGWYYGQNGKRGVQDYARADWLPALLSGYQGKTASAECDARAWELFKTLYLAGGKPSESRRTLSNCYQRVKESAQVEGWAWPSKKTIERRVKSDISRRVRVLMREGAEALDRLFPAMERDRSMWHSMQAINGDGVEFKPQIAWPDGTVSHAKCWVWQDLYSNYILSYRPDVSENKDMLRLSYGDLVERYGIPELAYIDNTTAAASKWLTGGTPNRYRWTIRDEDPIGIIPQVGTQVKFVTPGHGQSKPIERSFQDLRELVDRNPRFDGRGTLAKPIPLAEFLEVLDIEIQRHNALEGRRTAVANGRSFEAVFRESYEQATIRRATAAQRKLWLLAAEKIRADTESGAVRLGRGPQGENRYWDERMAEHAGEHLVVRFDPQRLHESVHVYTLDGQYICEAACTWKAGFNDTNAARAYHRHRSRYRKHTRKAAEAERGMRMSTAIEHLQAPERPDPPDAKVVAPMFPTRSRAAVGSDVTPEDPEAANNAEQRDSQFAKGVAKLWEQKKRDLI